MPVSVQCVMSSIVLVGRGFTPGQLQRDSLRVEFPDGPINGVVTPPLASQSFKQGYQVRVLEDRLEVRHDNPSTVNDQLAQNALLKLLSFWPLATVSAVGLNLTGVTPYANDAARDGVVQKLLRVEGI